MAVVNENQLSLFNLEPNVVVRKPKRKSINKEIPEFIQNFDYNTTSLVDFMKTNGKKYLSFNGTINETSDERIAYLPYKKQQQLSSDDYVIYPQGDVFLLKPKTDLSSDEEILNSKVDFTSYGLGLSLLNKPSYNFIYVDDNMKTWVLEGVSECKGNGCIDMWLRFAKHTNIYPNKEVGMYLVDSHFERVEGERFGGYSALTTLNPKDYTIKYKGKWKECTKLYQETIFLQSDEELLNIVKKNNPYLYEFINKNYTDGLSKPLHVLLMCPQLEILSKAGFSFANKIIKQRAYSNSEIDALNRLIKPGSNPKTIFKTDKKLYTVLKNEMDLLVWDNFRKLYKKGINDKETIQLLFEHNYNNSQLYYMNSILLRKWNDKPVFTYQKLINYLDRVDMYEAIPTDEALMLLSDYLRMCDGLHVKPKLDGDSLKREHDVFARTSRQIKDTQFSHDVLLQGVKLSKYAYQNEQYLCRPIKNYDDLIKEANMQHNCVASYARSIANGTSCIFVARKIDAPNQSLVTIEVNSDFTHVRQKFLAYNKPIFDKDLNEFISEWQSHAKEVHKHPELYITEEERTFVDTGSKDFYKKQNEFSDKECQEYSVLERVFDTFNAEGYEVKFTRNNDLVVTGRDASILANADVYSRLIAEANAIKKSQNVSVFKDPVLFNDFKECAKSRGVDVNNIDPRIQEDADKALKELVENKQDFKVRNEVGAR